MHQARLPQAPVQYQHAPQFVPQIAPQFVPQHSPPAAHPWQATGTSIANAVGTFQKGMRIARLVMAGLGVLIAIPVIVGGLWFSQAEKKPHVVVVNEGATSAEFFVDGSSVGTIESKKSILVPLEAGAHTYQAKGGATDAGSMNIKNQDFYRGLLVLGNQGRVAVVTKQYGSSHLDDKIDLVAKGAALKDIDGSRSALEIDKAFPDTVKVTKNASSTTVTRLCHVDPRTLKSDDPKVECPGF